MPARGQAMRKAAFHIALGFMLVGTAASAAQPTIHPDKPNAVTFPAREARFVRFLIRASSSSQPCIDELEVYGPDGKRNLALAKDGAKPTASSCLPGYAIHKIAHLNDGLYGNSHSWISATTKTEWAQIELPRAAKVAKVVFSRDRKGRYRDRVPIHFEIQLSLDGRQFKTVREVKAAPPPAPPRPPGPAAPEALPKPLTWDGLLRYAFGCERNSLSRVDRSKPLSRVLGQMERMIERFAAKGIDVASARRDLAKFQRRDTELTKAKTKDASVALDLYMQARLAKRQLFLRDPDLAPLKKILFVKRHPYLPSHNYSVILDGRFRGGGGVCILEIPRRGGRLVPGEGRLTVLFDAKEGMARDPMADFDASKVYFAYRPSAKDYWHIYVMNAKPSTSASSVEPRRLTDGPFHDYYPCPLPDGGIAFISTRCKSRFLCWRPQAYVLFRMEADGSRMKPLSFANLSEWAPSVMTDGRIIWTRSEYLDKGANYGHTLWAIRPDGTHPELIYGNDTRNCSVNGRQVPGTSEISCTLISHFGDFNGPIALVDIAKGRFNPRAAASITPEVKYNYDRGWPRRECFRDPVPVARDYFLVSHAPWDRFGLYVIDRYGNREILYLDPAIGSMCPEPLRPVTRPPVLPAVNEAQRPAGEHPDKHKQLGQFFVANVYEGLGPKVKPGSVKYIRVCQEVKADLMRLPSGEYRNDHRPFEDYYATPTHKVRGPHGWPSYVAKASLGIVPVEADGSANFYAPAGKVLYFQVLDGEFNELQRMRSVIQLQGGEKRGCIGCHEDRSSTAPSTLQRPLAMRQEPRALEPPPWGAVPFSYQKVVQPVFDAKCVRCHNAKHKKGLDLTGTLDSQRVPASYRKLIERGLVHYFSFQYALPHAKAQPLSFGTVKSKLITVLEAGHNKVKLTPSQMRRIKCWIDLNCPLWPDYIFRPSRPAHATKTPRAN